MGAWRSPAQLIQAQEPTTVPGLSRAASGSEFSFEGKIDELAVYPRALDSNGNCATCATRRHRCARERYPPDRPDARRNGGRRSARLASENSSGVDGVAARAGRLRGRVGRLRTAGVLARGDRLGHRRQAMGGGNGGLPVRHGWQDAAGRPGPLPRRHRRRREDGQVNGFPRARRTFPMA